MKIEKKIWVIMDKGHKAIACGTTRNRHLQLIDGDFSRRLITYNTKGKAEAGFKVSQFYLGDAHDYMEETYGEMRKSYDGTREYIYVDQRAHCTEIYEAVEATLILELDNGNSN